MTNKENKLLLLSAEKEHTELRLKEQIHSIRNTLDNLEYKLNNKEHLFESDGLQGDASYIDVYLTKIVAYERAIKIFNE